jgi:predicted  nucleic acid-binding Zn-ribbon protein
MAKELSVAEKLRNLYELQSVDSKIDEIEILKGELPMEVSDLEDEIAGLETRIAKLGNVVEGLEDEVSNHNANIKEAEALIERYSKQLDNVKNSREYEALVKELELQKLEIQLSEKKIREARQTTEKKQETLDATVERKERKDKELEAKKVELKEIISKTEKEEKVLRKRTEEARKHVEPRLIKAYDKIRESYRNGLAVVHVERNSCGGCFNKIPPQVQLEISMRKKIIVCEHCGRVLVDDNILEVDTAKVQ